MALAVGSMVKDLTGTMVAMGMACPGQQGNWVCLTHQQAFQNNLQIDLHEVDLPEEDGVPAAHQFVWNCHSHGLEA